MNVTHLLSIASSPDGASYVSSSISPTPDRLLLAFILTTCTSGSAAPTVIASGNGLTWTAHGTATVNTSGSRRLTVLRALTGEAPSAGPVTFDMVDAGQGTTARGVTYTIVEVQGADPSGTNGSAGLTSVYSTHNGAASDTEKTWTIDQPTRADTLALAFLWHESNEVAAVTGFNWTEISGSDVTFQVPDEATHLALASPFVSAEVTSTWAIGSSAGVLALEILAPVSVKYHIPRRDLIWVFGYDGEKVNVIA